jgi:hypothetical protein
MNSIEDPVVIHEWQVKFNNIWNYDYVGWVPGAVKYYRNNRRSPCSYIAYQQMMYKDPLSAAYYNYGKVNVLKGIIRRRTVVSERARKSRSRLW